MAAISTATHPNRASTSTEEKRFSLNNQQFPLSIADVNHDGSINVMDATEIINIYLNNR